MEARKKPITEVIGAIPYRIALAGGWIDQPFVSRLNPNPPGSMVVVQIESQFRWMDRAGLCTSTRDIAMKLWNGLLPQENPETLVRQLYAAENAGKTQPSGSQDMIGLIRPGINRLDYDYEYEGGVFPKHIESNTDPEVARWLERVLYVIPVAPRPEGYNPLGRKNLDPQWIAQLGRSGRDCFEAIVGKDLPRLGASFHECMTCWRTILPDTVEHETLTVDLLSLLDWYQQRYAGAMYSGCGGGYLYVISEEPVPGGFPITIRTGQ
ncbi:MAG: hypothetical protein JW828_16505 [Sedimentisphaerales bacterium]|nr:hypothetical protein [Sedimentisphaerales bacterium]